MTDRPAFPEFDIEGVWLDSAYYHPAPRGARDAVAAYMAFRAGTARVPPLDTRELQVRVRERYARLIGAEFDDIAYVPSATAGENMVAAALRLGPGARVITDALHYAGSLCIYEGLRARGLDVEVIPAWGGGIPLEAIAEALETPTTLVALSAVSQRNGFQHDLSAVCALAHSRGALVYADVMQAVGAQPFDVRASGVDFCGTSSYKWLMGEQGLGFLYVRPDRLGGLTLPHFGARQSERYPIPLGRTARVFELGTNALSVLAGLDYSLGAILEVTPQAIAARTAPLRERLRRELPPYGLIPMTPDDSDGPVLSFQTAEAPALIQALNRAGVFISVYADYVRVAPSMFNTHQDIDRLVDAVARL